MRVLPTMNYGEPEMTSTPCPACGCEDIFTAVAPPGAREMPLYPACYRCGLNVTSAPRSPPIRRGSPALRGEFPIVASPSVKSQSAASINGDK